MEPKTDVRSDRGLLLRKVIHRVNNLAAVIMTEAELALLLGQEAERTAALHKTVSTVEELRVFLKQVQREIGEEQAMMSV
jgi:hypothetical protein